MKTARNTELQVRRFISERCEAAEGCDVALNDLYPVYQTWCEAMREKQVSRVRMYRLLTRHLLIPADLGPEGQSFKGLRLKNGRG